MKYLVATTETQGFRKSDFCFCPEGEPVVFGYQCDAHGNDDADGPCGCQRSLVGIGTKKGTTTIRVAEGGTFTPSAYTSTLLKMESSQADIDDLLSSASLYEVGDILEYREYLFHRRPKIPKIHGLRFFPQKG